MTKCVKFYVILLANESHDRGVNSRIENRDVCIALPLISAVVEERFERIKMVARIVQTVLPNAGVL